MNITISIIIISISEFPPIIIVYENQIASKSMEINKLKFPRFNCFFYVDLLLLTNQRCKYNSLIQILFQQSLS